MKKTTLKIHPAANWLPELPPTEYEELKADIQARGQREPILVKHGYIIDGRHRYRVCQDLGKFPDIIEYEGGGDIIAEILSRNILRRHLTTDQRAMLVAKLRGDKLSKQAETRMKAGNPVLKSTQGRTWQPIAKEAQVSQHKARAALHVLKHEPGTVDAVIAGKQRLAKLKPKRKKRPQPEKSFREIVEKKWLHFMCKFPVHRCREVREIIREILDQVKEK